MSTNIFLDQALMMKAFGQTIMTENPAQASLYMRLVVEELEETFCAANPAKEKEIKDLCASLAGLARVDEIRRKTDVFDGILDLLVVTVNFGLSLGLPLQDGWDEVLRSNMAKVGPTGVVERREDGKVLKPDGWTPPDLAAVLQNAPALSLAELNKTEALAQVPSKPSPADRYLNLALIQLGEALTAIGNLRQRQTPPGDGYAVPKLDLSRVAAALSGKIWEPPAVEREKNKNESVL